MSLDLSTLSGSEIAVSLRSGKVDATSVVAHLASRLIPAEHLGVLYSAIPPEFIGAVALAQAALMQKKPTTEKKSPVRATVSESGKRIVIVKADVTGSYTMTNPPESFLWILDHAADVRAACEAAQKITAEEVAKTVANKLVAKANKADKANA